MNIWTFITGLIKPITDIIDHTITSETERLRIKSSLFEMQNTLTAKVIEYEASLLDAKAKVITAELQGNSWLQQTWRPITMLTFLILVVADTFGLTTFRLASQAWILLQIGLGGYVVGRSIEKVVPKINATMRKDASS